MNPPDIDHLYFDGEHYDAKANTNDVPFWVLQAKKYGDPILELGVGTGRIAIPLAREGFKVTGVDISDSMLEQARRKLSNEQVSIELVKADLRDFQIATKFPLILIPANTIVHFTELEDLQACLSCVKRHLEPNGRFIIDTHNPKLKYLYSGPDKPVSSQEYPNPNGNGMVVLTTTNRYNAATQINTITMKYELSGQDEEVIDTLRIRILFPQELDALMKYNGFKIERKLGDYDGGAFDSESPKQILICCLPTEGDSG